MEKRENVVLLTLSLILAFAYRMTAFLLFLRILRTVSVAVLKKMEWYALQN